MPPTSDDLPKKMGKIYKRFISITYSISQDISYLKTLQINKEIWKVVTSAAKLAGTKVKKIQSSNGITQVFKKF